MLAPAPPEESLWELCAVAPGASVQEVVSSRSIALRRAAATGIIPQVRAALMDPATRSLYIAATESAGTPNIHPAHLDAQVLPSDWESPSGRALGPLWLGDAKFVVGPGLRAIRATHVLTVAG